MFFWIMLGMGLAQEWWKEDVFYQIYPRSFQDSDGDGVGDVRGIIDRLDYLEWLGVDVLWLSPIFCSPQKDFGYDILDYTCVDPVMGDMQDVDELIADVHQRGMKIIFDGVFNHTSDQHPWFVESMDKDSAKADWYLWRDEPNNWASAFGGSAWTWNERRQQYYLHSFAPAQPDLNWRNPEVQHAILDSMEFWLQKGVDGFRLDVFNAYYKDLEYRDNPVRYDLLSTVGGVFYPYLRYEHIYDRDRPEMLSALEQMRALVDRYDAVLVGETLDEQLQYDHAKDYVGDTALQLVFNFSVLHSSWNDIASVSEAYIQEFSDAWPTWVLNNHDFARTSKRWNNSEDKKRIVAMISLLAMGTPFVYYGEEIGLPEGKLSKKDIQDPTGQKYYPFFKGRDGARTPMQWNESVFAGFSTVQPWLPIQHNMSIYSVEAQRQSQDSLLWLYHDLIAIHHDHSVIRYGNTESVQKIGDVLWIERQWQDAVVCLVVNLGSKSVPHKQKPLDIVISSDPNKDELLSKGFMPREYGVLYSQKCGVGD